jgi:2-aminoadipate transaminase
MNNIFSDRISDVPRSFIREIFKVAVDTSVISFAGGLPNRDFFPVKELQAAANRVFESAGKEVLQYSNSEGYPQLRRLSETQRVHLKTVFGKEGPRYSR